jgi:hypothetical protein
MKFFPSDCKLCVNLIEMWCDYYRSSLRFWATKSTLCLWHIVKEIKASKIAGVVGLSFLLSSEKVCDL